MSAGIVTEYLSKCPIECRKCNGAYDARIIGKVLICNCRCHVEGLN